MIVILIHDAIRNPTSGGLQIKWIVISAFVLAFFSWMSVIVWGLTCIENKIRSRI